METSTSPQPWFKNKPVVLSAVTVVAAISAGFGFYIDVESTTQMVMLTATGISGLSAIVVKGYQKWRGTA